MERKWRELQWGVGLGLLLMVPGFVCEIRGGDGLLRDVEREWKLPGSWGTMEDVRRMTRTGTFAVVNGFVLYSLGLHIKGLLMPRYAAELHVLDEKLRNAELVISSLGLLGWQGLWLWHMSCHLQEQLKNKSLGERSLELAKRVWGTGARVRTYLRNKLYGPLTDAAVHGLEQKIQVCLKRAVIVGIHAVDLCALVTLVRGMANGSSPQLHRGAWMMLVALALDYGVMGPPQLVAQRLDP